MARKRGRTGMRFGKWWLGKEIRVRFIRWRRGWGGGWVFTDDGRQSLKKGMGEEVGRVIQEDNGDIKFEGRMGVTGSFTHSRDNIPLTLPTYTYNSNYYPYTRTWRAQKPPKPFGVNRCPFHCHYHTMSFHIMRARFPPPSPE